MKSSAASRRYAKALFQLARDRDQLEPVGADLGVLADWLEQSGEFRRFVENPLIPPEKRAAVLQELVGDRAHELTSRFLAFLSAKERLPLLAGICETFRDRYNELQGILRVTIDSATPLTDDQVAQINQRLHVRFGKEIESRVRIDPALLGGFKIRVGDVIHDYSIACQLQALKEELINA